MKKRPKIPSGIAPSSSYADRQREWWEWYPTRWRPGGDQLALVADKLFEIGLDDNSVLMDFGAGHNELDIYLRQGCNWLGLINNEEPIMEGRDLNSWWSAGWHDYAVSLEALEFINKPGELIAKIEGATRKGLVFVVHNQEVTDPLDLGDRYCSPITQKDWQQLYFDTQILTFFGKENDGILAWKDLRES